ncbi:MAG: hypothetical protein EKK63_07890 [Acinetobacter sp.]|nr:MAG: hypothetical protein EKK63_07890 [Acinetobacter sp.]
MPPVELWYRDIPSAQQRIFVTFDPSKVRHTSIDKMPQSMTIDQAVQIHSSNDTPQVKATASVR